MKANKDMKKMVVGFSIIVAFGIGGLGYNIYNATQKKQVKVEPKIEVKGKKKDKQVILHDQNKPELEEEQGRAILEQAIQSFALDDIDKVVKDLENVSAKFSLSKGETNLRLASMLSDALTLQAVAVETDLDRGVELVSSLSDSASITFGPIYLLGQVLAGVVWDSESLDVSGVEAIEYVSHKFIQSDSSEFAENQIVTKKLSAETKDLYGVWKYEFTAYGNPLVAYVSEFSDGTIRLIGYFDEGNNPANQFQTVSFYSEHSGKLSDAVKNDWEE